MTASLKFVNVGIIGPGLVGRALIKQLMEFGASNGVRIAGIINSKSMLLIKGDDWESAVKDWPNNSETSNMQNFTAHMASQAVPVMVDCTSSDAVAGQYPEWLSQKLSIVTPNKKGFSGDMKLYKTLSQANQNTYVYHEATVGAGLPIISTLKSLVRTGDKIVKIEGIFSGTMSFLFNTFSAPNGAPESFSKCVGIAKDSGYTEPDPRDDLNGMDVARKVTILGRVAGLDISLDTLPVENVVPEALRSCQTSEEFMTKLPEFDEHFGKLNAEAAARGEVLRYVGTVDPSGKSCTALKAFPNTHPFASLKGSDNIISFITERYPVPLIVQGAGAGADVTAAGIFSDILAISDRHN
ncbi:hypothetical protein SARC_10188 [Sphaeroforma arctica JP610]|uniref:Homoserine dehydrogenase n=1 Tax=Sphaeroforma arctica JP610 TaxID=667725 RepID=A0A0L0FKN6_9EUKA|nr:hypothetical protein SARC_10188 [Sphaeroforma arctica JP610]KNC77349.1 hypothetical protein SARC_10188 [Sphaeroforma arctica JP610]|eukprot:XP_014151251.1 hypothetical protein SARC_10188 [Sphaeroforma arctica JP610]